MITLIIQSPINENFKVVLVRSKSNNGYEYSAYKQIDYDYDSLEGFVFDDEPICEGEIKDIDVNLWYGKNLNFADSLDEEEVLRTFLENNFDSYIDYIED